jgi:plastocyanin
VTPKGGSTGSGPATSWTGVPAVVGPGGSEGAPAGPTTGPPGEGETPASTGPAHVQVTAEDTEAFRFVLSRATVPAGKVEIEFVNHGQDEHNLNAEETSEGSVVGSIPNTAPNAHPTVTLDMRAGSYTLFCSLPGHEAKGMKATLTVE